MPTPSFKAILREDKVNEQGLCPLFLRITYERKRSLVNLNIKVKPKDWNKTKGLASKSYHNSNRLNNLILSRISQYQEAYLILKQNEQVITAASIKAAVTNTNVIDFLVFFEKHLQRRIDEEKYSTHDKEQVVYNKLKLFTKNVNLSIHKVNYEFLESFRDHLRDHYSNSVNTIHSNLRVIRMLLNKAERKDLIKPDNNPFRKFKLEKEETSRVYLNEEELNLIKALELNPDHRIYHHRQMFIFACYACGLRVSDLLTLKWSNISETHLELKMKKTKRTLKFKLLPQAKEILSEYKDNNNTFVFPFLTCQSAGNLKELDRQISSCTAYYNKDLKKIASKCGIEKNISSHIARHTFATIALRQGMRIEYVSKLLGHKDISTTQIYSKIVNEELDNAMDKLDF